MVVVVFDDDDEPHDETRQQQIGHRIICYELNMMLVTCQRLFHQTDELQLRTRPTMLLEERAREREREKGRESILSLSIHMSVGDSDEAFQ